MVKKVGRGLRNNRSYYYNYDSKTSKTQIHALFVKKKTNTDRVWMRFSVVSPDSVIDQTFKLIGALNKIFPFKIFDSEIYNHIMRQLRQRGAVMDHLEPKSSVQEQEVRNQCYIEIDAEAFRKNPMKIEKRKLLADDSFKKTNVGGDNETFGYIMKKGITEKIFGWIKKEF